MAIATQPTIAPTNQPISCLGESKHVSDIDNSKIEYPESDGAPMGETGFHVRTNMHLYGALDHFFHNQDDVYVAADMFMYYEKGNPHACKAPDLMVIKGVDKDERRTFKIWEENAAPCFIIEITSKSTMLEDLMTKSKVYASLGVREYFMFDPLREYLEEGLVGFQLADNEYVLIPYNKEGCLFSEELGVIFRPQNEGLRVVDPKTGVPIPSLVEAVIIAEKAVNRAEEEAKRAEGEANRAEQQTLRADRLEAKLRAMGIDPDS